MKSFQDIELIAPLRLALADENYQHPTLIQAQTLPAALDGHDVLGCAQTGTGKTAAFALPILNWLGRENRKATPNRPLALIMAPTRELAIQIEESCATYGQHLRLRLSVVYGGVSQRNQVRKLDRGAHILVATPGRLLDLMGQGHVKLDKLEMFVLDEADRMLDMGFLPDLKRIIRELPEERQSLFFSATVPPKIKSLAKQLLWNPIHVHVEPKVTSVENINQQLMLVAKGDKQQVLRRILSAADVQLALVFTKTKRGANRLAEKLERSGIKSTAIHGNKSQAARQKALTAFRTKEVRVLVATDVAARGIDIDGITHVVNYDMPHEPESYVHRIGRTGRAGAAGVALSFCSPEENRDLRAIEKLIGKKVPIINQPQRTDTGVEREQRQAGKHADHPTHRRRAASSGAAKTGTAKPKRRKRRRRSASTPCRLNP